VAQIAFDFLILPPLQVINFILEIVVQAWKKVNSWLWGDKEMIRHFWNRAETDLSLKFHIFLLVIRVVILGIYLHQNKALLSKMSSMDYLSIISLFFGTID
jgi:hypothetical protein